MTFSERVYALLHGTEEESRAAALTDDEKRKIEELSGELLIIGERRNTQSTA